MQNFHHLQGKKAFETLWEKMKMLGMFPFKEKSNFSAESDMLFFKRFQFGQLC